jgi:tetratricopeptide (TPR) repeat protein
MVILASIGLKTLIDFFKSKYIKILIIIIYVGALYHPVRHIIVNTDNIYIYFNEFIGGIDNTKGKYENDYYFNSLKSGSKWLLENELKNLPLENGKKIRVASNGSISYYFRNDTARVKPFYLKYYERNNYDWDYAIIFCNYLSPYQLSHGLWPPKNTIHTIYVDNTPVCAILKRTDKNDYYGYKAEQQDSLELAYNYYLKALQIDPNNESVIINLGSLYNRTHNFNETVSLMNNCLTNVYPDFDNALDILSVAYLNLGDYESAQRVLNRLINVNYKYVNAYYNMALLYLQQNLNDLALQYLDQALKINGNFKPAYLLIAEILNSQGRKEDANSYIQAAKQLK